MCSGVRRRVLSYLTARYPAQLTTDTAAIIMSSEDKVNCVIDRNVLNAENFGEFVGSEGNIGLWVFAPLCGRNRGAFVLDPPDGHTYGCVQFPPNFHELAGVKYSNITDSNSIEKQYKGKNITAGEAVDLVDLFVQSVFYSSRDGNPTDPMACAVNGLTKLECKANKILSKTPIRAVTLVGALVPAPWATGGKALTLEEAKTYYTADDFSDMKKLGLNAVQIPVPLSIFDKASDGTAKIEFLGTLMNQASDADLGAIVVLENDVDDEEEASAVQAAAAFVKSHTNLVSLVVPSQNMVAAARLESTTIPLMIPTNQPGLPFLQTADPNIMAAIDQGHTTSVADIASSESMDDRNKLYYHEMMACLGRSPIEYALCYRGLPAYVVNGFNLAIDNCIDKDSVDFVDYGQCGRFDETIDSGWWHAHRKSFAKRQLASFEAGAGWTFDAWKLYKENPKKVDVIDKPAKLWTLKNVAAAGLMPNLHNTHPSQHGCLVPPANDVALGDDTLAPTAGPPPECKGGWWSEEKGKCDYWVPPPDPTPCPTSAPIPECDEGGYWSPDSQECEYCPKALTTGSQLRAGTVGAVIAIVLGAIVVKLLGRRRSGYTEVPELTV